MADESALRDKWKSFVDEAGDGTFDVTLPAKLNGTLLTSATAKGLEAQRAKEKPAETKRPNPLSFNKKGDDAAE